MQIRYLYYDMHELFDINIERSVIVNLSIFSCGFRFRSKAMRKAHFGQDALSKFGCLSLFGLAEPG